MQQDAHHLGKEIDCSFWFWWKGWFKKKKKNSSILEGALLPLMVSADFSGQECDAASTPSVSRPLAQPDTEIQAAKSEENDKLEWNYFINKIII